MAVFCLAHLKLKYKLTTLWQLLHFFIASGGMHFMLFAQVIWQYRIRKENMGKFQLSRSAASSLSMLIICSLDHLIWGPAKLAIDYPIEPDHKTSPLFESGETCILFPPIDRPILSSQTRYSAMSCGASQELARAEDLLRIYNLSSESTDIIFLLPGILFRHKKTHGH